MSEQGKLPKNCFMVGKKLMGICSDCGSIVRIDKPIFGSIHLCLNEEERKLKYKKESTHDQD